MSTTNKIKVDRGLYKHIKGYTNEAMAEGKIPSYKDKKRSRARFVYYQELSKLFDLGHSTINNIGKSRNYPHFRQLQNWKQSVKDESQDTAIVDVKKGAESVLAQYKLRMDRMSNDLRDANKQIDRLSSEMALIKARKGRWFK